MTDKTDNPIEVTSVAYYYQGQPLSPDHNVPAGEDYEVHKNNDAGELQYSEVQNMGVTKQLLALFTEEPLEQRAAKILKHAIEDESQFGDHASQVEIRLIIPDEMNDLPLQLAENEQAMSFAVLVGNINNPDDIEFQGYIAEVYITEPIMTQTRKVQFTTDKQLYSIDYIMVTMDDENKLTDRLIFTEYGKPALEEIEQMVEEQGEDALDGKYIFPACDQDYLDEVAEYLDVTLVGHADFEENPIDNEDIENHTDFKRQWFNAEQKPTFLQLYVGSGIGMAEIYDVPREKTMHVLHAYYRLMHKLMHRFALDHPQNTPYTVVYEPVSDESTEAVPLEPGQLKRTSYTCTIEGVTVVSDCMVFGEDQMPIKKMTFGTPGEKDLIHEEIFNFDDNGQLVDSEVINHSPISVTGLP